MTNRNWNLPAGVTDAEIDRHYGESDEPEHVEREEWFTRVGKQAHLQLRAALRGGRHTVDITRDNAAQELQAYLDDAIGGLEIGRTGELVAHMAACLRALEAFEEDDYGTSGRS